jgi:hypothetical protein
MNICKGKRKPKGQSIMDNPETQVILLQKPEGAIKNEQFIDTGNIVSDN